MTTIVRVADSAHLLSLVPALAGCTPSQSVVLLPFSGGRTQGALRLDLPRGDVAAFAATAIGIACRVAHIDAIAVVVYSDEPLDTFLGSDPLREALGHCADAGGLRVVESLRVGRDGWLDTDGQRRGVDELPPVSAVPGIADVSGDQRAGAALPDPDRAAQDHVEQALQELEKVFDIMRVRAANDRAQTPDAPAPNDEHHPGHHATLALTPRAGHRAGLTAALTSAPSEKYEAEQDTSDEERIDPRSLETFLRLDNIPQFYEDILDEPGPLDPYTTAALAWCFTTPMLRDVALVQWARDIDVGHDAFAAQLRYAHDHEHIPAHIGDVLIGRGPHPERNRMHRGLTALRTAAVHSPRHARAGLLAGAAWISWALGRSTHAEYYLSLVHDIDPEHSFAGLLRGIVASALLPDWVFTAAGSVR